MGLMARFIDRLSAEQKDNIIQAQGWGWAGRERLINEETYSAMAGKLCLMDNACGAVGSWMEEDPITVQITNSLRKPEALAFDNACHRFGMQRVVRACKMRAAKPQPAVLHETVWQHRLQATKNNSAKV